MTGVGLEDGQKQVVSLLKIVRRFWSHKRLCCWGEEVAPPGFSSFLTYRNTDSPA